MVTSYGSAARWALAAALASIGGLLTCQTAVLAQPVKIQLRGGRLVTGELDPRSDSRRLWLRFKGTSIVLSRSYDWDQVEEAWYGQERLSPQELAQRAIALVPGGEETAPGGEETAPDREETAPAAGNDVGRRETQAAARRRARRNRPIFEPSQVYELRIQARLANWDDDAETDGLLLTLYALGHDGLPVRTGGFLDVTLVGERPGSAAVGNPVVEIGRWAKTIEPSDFASGSVTVRLGFQTLHPEFDLDLSPQGIVSARLAIAGQGTFEATTGTINIRTMSMMRDRLQYQTHRRLFPWERTNQGR